jgi:ammonium transporter, Amt family
MHRLLQARRTPGLLWVFVVFILGLAAGPAHAAAVEPVQTLPASNLNSGDTAWMLTSAALVLMMTGPGLALFYSGLVRRKNVLATMMQSFILMAAVSVVWVIVGYTLAFDVGTPFIGGFHFAFLRHVAGAPCEYAPTIPHTTWMAYQMMFAVITPALICGAYAERMKFSSMLIFSLAWLLLVYCPVAHMVWGKGGYFNASYANGRHEALDFAGGIVVHLTSGVAALVCTLVMGRRRGYGRVPMPPHSVVLSVIGAGLLWVGWFGFNAGSALHANALASAAFVNTHLAGAAAALAWLFVEWLKGGKATVLGVISGAVAGLAIITPASGFTTPMLALLMGAIGGVACFFAATSLKHALGYDDSLDVFGVHGISGILGSLLVGVFAVAAVNGKSGLIEGNAHQLFNQLYAATFTALLSIVASLALLYALKATLGLRVTEAEEYDGLDISLHGESGYNFEEAFPGTVLDEEENAETSRTVPFDEDAMTLSSARPELTA